MYIEYRRSIQRPDGSYSLTRWLPTPTWTRMSKQRWWKSQPMPVRNISTTTSLPHRWLRLSTNLQTAELQNTLSTKFQIHSKFFKPIWEVGPCRSLWTGGLAPPGTWWWGKGLGSTSVMRFHGYFTCSSLETSACALGSAQVIEASKLTTNLVGPLNRRAKISWKLIKQGASTLILYIIEYYSEHQSVRVCTGVA